MIKLGFLASGNGTSLRAIIAACKSGELSAEPRLVVSNKREAPALAFAHEHGIASAVIPTAKTPDAADFALATALESAGVEWVVLSGYLRKLGPKTLSRFAGRILNVHPALLPKFGGRGFYGRKVHEAVIAAGESVSGATVHLVDEHYDHGATIAQAEVAVLPGDTAADLETRIMAEEPKLFVEILKDLADGRLKL